MNPFLRTEWLIGSDALARLEKKRVAVFGLGGVGGHCAEALVRAGIGAIDIVDCDVVDITNINRQLIATQETVGRLKAEVMKERLLSIRPDLSIRAYALRIENKTAPRFDFTDYDYIVDAVDEVHAKLLLAKSAEDARVSFISAMGAGNKLHPEALEIAMLFDTSVCPLARVMRREVKRRGIKDFPVVYSKEVPHKAGATDERTPASISFVPPASGLLIASKVVRDLMEEGK